MLTLKTIFGSMKKSKKLNKISKVLSKSIEVDDLISSISGNDDSKKNAEEELYNLVESDPNLKMVMKKYDANRETLRKIYISLNLGGASQWVKGNYVSVSALAFCGSLDYILKNKDKLFNSADGQMDICLRVITYFQNGEIGIIKD